MTLLSGHVLAMPTQLISHQVTKGRHLDRKQISGLGETAILVCSAK